MTRHWLELVNQWLKETRPILRLDTTKTWLDSDSARQNFRWLWLEGLVTLTLQKWLGHITGLRKNNLKQLPAKIHSFDFSPKNFLQFNASISWLVGQATLNLKPQSYTRLDTTHHFYWFHAPTTVFKGVVMTLEPMKRFSRDNTFQDAFIFNEQNWVKSVDFLTNL